MKIKKKSNCSSTKKKDQYILEIRSMKKLKTPL